MIKKVFLVSIPIFQKDQVGMWRRDFTAVVLRNLLHLKLLVALAWFCSWWIQWLILLPIMTIASVWNFPWHCIYNAYVSFFGIMRHCLSYLPVTQILFFLMEEEEPFYSFNVLSLFWPLIFDFMQFRVIVVWRGCLLLVLRDLLTFTM